MKDTLICRIDRKLEFRENLTKSILSLDRLDPLISRYLQGISFEEKWKDIFLSLDSNFTRKVWVSEGFNYVNSAYSPWSEAKRQIVSMGPLGNSHTVHYFGIGLGYHLFLLLKENPDLKKLFLYEYDPDWLIQALSIHDFSGFFSTHSIKIFLNSVRNTSSPLLKSSNDIVWINPVIGKVYDSYYSKILSSGVNIDTRNQNIAMVVDLHSDPLYRNLSKKVSDELSRLDWSLHRCSRGLQDVKTQCFKNRPKFIFSVSFSPELSDVSRNIKVPYLCWEVDKVMNSNFIRPETLSAETYVFTTYDEDVLKFRYAGANAYYLPPISNIENSQTTDEVSGEELERFGNDISFVGSSLLYENNDFLIFLRSVQEVMEKGDKDVKREGKVLLNALKRALDRQAPFTLKNIYRLPEILVEELNSLYPLKFFRFSHQQLNNILAKECCTMQRLNYLKGLSPLQVSIFGNPDWESFSEPNLVYKGRADYDCESRKIYKYSKINIDITRIYQLDGFSDRVLNVLSYGGFLMMNRTKIIEKSFDVGKELVLFDSPEELKKQCEYYLHSDVERKEIAVRGQQRALKEHSVKKRIEEIFSRLPVLFQK